MKNQSQPPVKHIAIILDGNRRWARQHKLEIIQGHSYVVNKVVEPLVDRCIELGIPYLTLWAFSTENWNRDKAEVSGLMGLFRDLFRKNASALHKKGVRINSIGDLSAFPKDIEESIKGWIKTSENNTNITVTFALNYGGRDDLVRGVNKLLVTKAGQKITQADISAVLDTATMPDPDLIIRPGGEKRLSGFMSWQNAYSELYFTDVLMPDFSPAELDKALADFAHRQRRFGA